MQIGDHIVASRLGYEHHGIYVGYNNVIHYAGGSSLNKKGVELTTYLKFINGGSCRTVPYSTRLSGAEAVTKARSRLGENNYNVVFNNCEHFARFCATGISSSYQVQDVMVEIAYTGGKAIASQTVRTLVDRTFPIVGIAYATYKFFRKS